MFFHTFTNFIIITIRSWALLSKAALSSDAETRSVGYVLRFQATSSFIIRTSNDRMSSTDTWILWLLQFDYWVSAYSASTGTAWGWQPDTCWLIAAAGRWQPTGFTCIEGSVALAYPPPSWHERSFFIYTDKQTAVQRDWSSWWRRSGGRLMDN